ncbi:MAG: hypothetical protein FJ009_14520 [Chloroflexi bacterium]|nr:hypothetical protein [Chloroflexota bacterium]
MSAIARWWHSDDLRGLWAATVCALIFAVAAALPLTPHDLWFHIRLGQQMVETRALITTDIFSYTQYGEGYFYNAWLSELVLYGLWTFGGAPLLVLTRALCVVCFYAIFLRLAWRASGSERWSAWFILFAALASFPHWQLRPQTFVLPIFALFVVILTRYLEQGRAPLSWLPIAMIAWVNLHGSFVFGLLLIGLTVIGDLSARIAMGERDSVLTRDQSLRLLVWAILTFAAVLLNPLGVGMLATVFDVGSTPAIQSGVLEWLPTTIREFPANLLYLLVLAWLIGMILSHARGRVAPALWALAFVGLGWYAQRNVLWASALLALPLALVWRDVSARVATRGSALATHWLARFFWQPKRLAGMRVLILLALVGVALLPMTRGIVGGDDLRAWVSGDTPIDVVEYIRKNNLRGRMYHEIGAGSYLMWALWPQHQVFIDSRINLYPAEQWREYFAVWHVSEGYETILDKYQVEYVLADTFWMPQLITALQKRERTWTLMFQSGQSFLFRRR